MHTQTKLHMQWDALRIGQVCGSFHVQSCKTRQKSPSVFNPFIVLAANALALVQKYAYGSNTISFDISPHFIRFIIQLTMPIHTYLANTAFKLYQQKLKRAAADQLHSLTFPHCWHLPFSVRRCTHWWCVVVCSRYWRTPTSRNVGLQAIGARCITMGRQLVCTTILQAEHFIRGPCFCGIEQCRELITILTGDEWDLECFCVGSVSLGWLWEGCLVRTSAKRPTHSNENCISSYLGWAVTTHVQTKHARARIYH